MGLYQTPSGPDGENKTQVDNLPRESAIRPSKEIWHGSF